MLYHRKLRLMGKPHQARCLTPSFIASTHLHLQDLRTFRLGAQLVWVEREITDDMPYQPREGPNERNTPNQTKSALRRPAGERLPWLQRTASVSLRCRRASKRLRKPPGHHHTWVRFSQAGGAARRESPLGFQATLSKTGPECGLRANTPNQACLLGGAAV